MTEARMRQATRGRVAHSAPGRIRVRIDAPRGHGQLHRLEAELNRLPETRSVRANHAARSVTVTFDPARTSVSMLLDQLQQIGLIALDLADPTEWAETLMEEVVPRAEDPHTLPGQVQRGLLAASGGRLDLFRVTVGLLLFSTVMQVRGALVHGHPIPWLRVLTYLLAAASIWTRHRETVDSGPWAVGSRTRLSRQAAH